MKRFMRLFGVRLESLSRRRATISATNHVTVDTPATP
jgi:hypothetical protein